MSTVGGDYQEPGPGDLGMGQYPVGAVSEVAAFEIYQTQSQLGITRCYQASVASGEEARRLITGATNAVRAALEVWTEHDFPSERAKAVRGLELATKELEKLKGETQ